jgi:hypothetical protein
MILRFSASDGAALRELAYGASEVAHLQQTAAMWFSIVEAESATRGRLKQRLRARTDVAVRSPRIPYSCGSRHACCNRIKAVMRFARALARREKRREAEERKNADEQECEVLDR